MITFRQEPGGPDMVENFIDEAMPLFEDHYLEIAKYKDVPLDIDVTVYKVLEELGKLRVFTARDDDLLVGYAIYTVSPHPHYKGTIHAIQDILYLTPSYRKGRLGMKLISYADDRLQKEGAQVVTQHVKVYADFGGILELLGYEKMEHIWVKRLNP